MIKKQALFALAAYLSLGSGLTQYQAAPSKIQSPQIYESDKSIKIEVADGLSTKTQNTNGRKTLHVISHSHQDAGWGRTAIEYFDGSKYPNGTWDHGGVYGILSNVTDYLWNNPTKRFTHAEIWFFQRWWYMQNNVTQGRVKQMVSEGRFEFVNGGWVASDEACPVYEDLVENIVVGHQWLKDNFNIVPRIAWHCDSFGHSSVMNELFQWMGYDSLFFGRMTDAERLQRIQNQTMIFNWQPVFEGPYGPKPPATPGLFTHLMYNTYIVPCGVPMTFYWNPLDAPSMRTDFMKQLHLNTTFGQQFIQCMQDVADSYQFDNVMITWGFDFAYWDAKNTFGLISDIMGFLQTQKANFDIKHSTVSEYLTAVRQEISDKKVNLTVFTDDFFPMEQIYKDSFWTGYFTTRGNSKRHMREFSTIATYSNTLYAMDMFKLQNLTSNLTQLTEASFNNSGLLGLMQHHDTITGTSYQYVADDYIYQLQNQTRNNSIPLTDNIERQLLAQGIQLQNFDPCYHEFNRRFQCPGLNFSFTNYDHFLVAVYNPSLHDQYVINIQLPVSNVKIESWYPSLKSYQNEGAEAFCYLSPDFYATHTDECEIFIYRKVPALSTVLLRISKDLAIDIAVNGSSQNLTLFNQDISLHLFHDAYTLENGLLNLTVNNTNEGTERRVAIDFRYYNAYNRTNDATDHNEGFYIFKTAQNESIPWDHSVSSIVAYKGQYKQMFVVKFKSNMNQNENTFLQVRFPGPALSSWNVPLDEVEFNLYFEGIEKYVPGMDVTMNFHCLDIQASDNLFYTDANALEFMRRKSNVYQSRYNTTTTQPTSSNFYPVTSAIIIEDTDLHEQMVVMNDRSTAASAFNNGTIEIIISRRQNTTDDLGNEESLNETEWINGMELGVRTPAKFILKFTHGRAIAQDTVRKNYLKDRHSLQMFTSILYNKEGEHTTTRINQDFDFDQFKHEFAVQSLQQSLKASNIDEISLKLVGTDTKTAQMTVAGNEMLTQDQANEIAIQFCNYVNSQVTSMDVAAECRQRTYVADLMLDGQLQGNSSRPNRGYMQKYQVLFNRP